MNERRPASVPMPLRELVVARALVSLPTRRFTRAMRIAHMQLVDSGYAYHFSDAPLSHIYEIVSFNATVREALWDLHVLGASVRLAMSWTNQSLSPMPPTQKYFDDQRRAIASDDIFPAPRLKRGDRVRFTPHPDGTIVARYGDAETPQPGEVGIVIRYEPGAGYNTYHAHVRFPADAVWILSDWSLTRI